MSVESSGPPSLFVLDLTPNPSPSWLAPNARTLLTPPFAPTSHQPPCSRPSPSDRCTSGRSRSTVATAKSLETSTPRVAKVRAHLPVSVLAWSGHTDFSDASLCGGSHVPLHCLNSSTRDSWPPESILDSGLSGYVPADSCGFLFPSQVVPVSGKKAAKCNTKQQHSEHYLFCREGGSYDTGLRMGRIEVADRKGHL